MKWGEKNPRGRRKKRKNARGRRVGWVKCRWLSAIHSGAELGAKIYGAELGASNSGAQPPSRPSTVPKSSAPASIALS